MVVVGYFTACELDLFYVTDPFFVSSTDLELLFKASNSLANFGFYEASSSSLTVGLFSGLIVNILYKRLIKSRL